MSDIEQLIRLLGSEQVRLAAFALMLLFALPVFRPLKRWVKRIYRVVKKGMKVGIF